jgi:hypothetical protein
VGSTQSAVSVDFSNPAGGTATAGGTDYTFTAGTLNWAAGDGASKTISIPITSDALSEGNETLNLLLSNPAGVGASLGLQASAVATIVDDDVTLGFSAGTSSVGEAGGSATLTVNRVGASAGAASVTWTVTGQRTASGSPSTATIASWESRRPAAPGSPPSSPATHAAPPPRWPVGSPAARRLSCSTSPMRRRSCTR